MTEDFLVSVTKISLLVAFASALAVFLQNPKRDPHSDPWYLPVIFVMAWQTLKY